METVKRVLEGTWRILGAAGSDCGDTGGEHAVRHTAPNARVQYRMRVHMHAHVVGQLAGNDEGSVGSGSAVNVAFGLALRSPTAYGSQQR